MHAGTIAADDRAATYLGKRVIHLFVDNARYHHAKLVRLARAAGLPDQAALHPDLLPAPRSDRTKLGLIASTITTTRSMKPPRLQRRNPDVPARGGAQELAPLLRSRSQTTPASSRPRISILA